MYGIPENRTTTIASETAAEFDNPIYGSQESLNDAELVNPIYGDADFEDVPYMNWPLQYQTMRYLVPMYDNVQNRVQRTNIRKPVGAIQFHSKIPL